MKKHLFKLNLNIISYFVGLFLLQQITIAAEDIPPPPPEPASSTTSTPAKEIKKSSDVLNVPPPPPPLPSGKTLPSNPPAATKTIVKKKKRTNRPEVTIVPGRGETRSEYRLNDILYMIHVRPKSRSEKTYYLIDHHGDGVFVRSNVRPKKTVPKWALQRTN